MIEYTSAHLPEAKGFLIQNAKYWQKSVMVLMITMLASRKILITISILLYS